MHQTKAKKNGALCSNLYLRLLNLEQVKHNLDKMVIFGVSSLGLRNKMRLIEALPQISQCQVLNIFSMMPPKRICYIGGN